MVSRPEATKPQNKTNADLIESMNLSQKSVSTPFVNSPSGSLYHTFLNALWHAKSPRQILRKFADILIQEFAVKQLDFVRLEMQCGSLGTMRKRQVQSLPVKSIPISVLDELKKLLKSVDLDSSDLVDGINQVLFDEQLFQVAIFRDREDEVTAILWDGRHFELSQSTLCDLLVRALQNEALWMRRVHRSERLVYIDDLTGLYNMRYFDVVVASELRRAERFKAQFTLLFIDLDGFKPINDSYGHLAGSAVLRQVALLIRSLVREVDVPIRYGGDEFVVLLIGAPCNKGTMVAERVRSKICEHNFNVGEGQWVHLTCSIGVASYPDHGVDRQSLVRVADASMYDSKRLGKNRVTVTAKTNDRSWNRSNTPT